jgi:hypothetical protein
MSNTDRRGLSSACLLSGLVTALSGCPAAADSTSVGVSFTTDRDAHDLSDPNSTKFEISAAHSFNNGVILGASTEYSNTAFSDKATVNLEGTVGYRVQLGDLFSVTGSAGLGERIQASGSGDNFPYYVFRIATDIKVTDDVTWNALSFRYRDAFDPDDDYLTPQIATGISYDLDEHNSISGKVEYNWKDWNPDTVGFGIGFKYRF